MSTESADQMLSREVVIFFQDSYRTPAAASLIFDLCEDRVMELVAKTDSVECYYICGWWQQIQDTVEWNVSSLTCRKCDDRSGFV